MRGATTQIRMPVFAATSAKLTSQTPPSAARARKTGCCHWLAPYTAHGPPSPCQERTQSATSQQLGTTTTAVRARSGGTGGGRPPPGPPPPPRPPPPPPPPPHPHPRPRVHPRHP